MTKEADKSFVSRGFRGRRRDAAANPAPRALPASP